MTLPRKLIAALALAGAVGLVGCTAQEVPSHYSIDVFTTELEVGSCIESAWNGDTRTDPFDFDAANFRVVDCESEHVAQVLGKVDIPAADEWAFYGTTDGPSQDEANAWLEGVCRSYEVLAREYLAGSTAQITPTVKPVYGLLGDAQLGFCLLANFAKGGLQDVVDVDAMLASGQQLGFDVGVPDSVAGWLTPDVAGTAVFWTDIQPGQCVEPYAGPDEETYNVVGCAEPHTAQALQWVAMPTEWGGVHPGAEIAQEYADGVCAALSSDPAITVDASDAAEDFIVDDTLISLCWAHRTDLAPLSAPL